MNMTAQVQTKSAPTPCFPTVQTGLLQRKCTCGGTPGPDGECAECRKKRSTLQRRPTSHVEPSVVPPIVNEVLRSPGQPLDPAIRTFMEPRFGHDFSRVRVHTDVRAAESAKAMNALAYTVGQDVVFGPGQFQPTSTSGRSLLAHELAHTIQQAHGSAPSLQRLVFGRDDDRCEREAAAVARATEAGGQPAQPTSLVRSIAPATNVQRQPTTSPFGGGRFGGGGASRSWEEGTSGETPPAGTRVARVVISCADGLIAFETLTTTYIYELQTCDVPIGSYDTTATIKGKDVEFDFGEQARRGRVFYFTYYIRPGQENPAALFKEQRAVHIDVVPELLLDTSDKPLACLLPLPNQELIGGESFQRQLFKPQDFEKTIWSHDIPLAQFGWVEVSAVAKGGASGVLFGSYGPGMLADICLFRTLGENRIAGQARFSFPANIGATVRLQGSLRVGGAYLSFIPVAAIEGELQAIGGGQARNNLNALVEVIYDLKSKKWAFQTDASVEGNASLFFQLTASAAVELLTRTIWKETWNLVNFGAGFDWAGGLRIKPDLSVEFDLGSIAKADLKAAAAPQAPGKPKVVEPPAESALPIQELLLALLQEDATVQTPEGLSEGDALPFQWHKPINFYAPVLDLPNAITPNQVNRADGPTPVTYNFRNRAVTEDIGVNPENWPFISKTFQLIPEPRSDKEKNRFGRLVGQLGFDRSEFEMDHVHDLAFGGDQGKDEFPNLWPLDQATNSAAGPRHTQQLMNYRDTLGNINGRWFEILLVRL